jgi:hypothetical protein
VPYAHTRELNLASIV